MARASTTIKVRPQTHARLQEIAKEDDRSMGEVITFLVDRYERERFWQGVAEDLDKFKADKEGYQRYLDEFAEWDNQSTESLDSEEPYYTDGEE